MEFVFFFFSMEKIIAFKKKKKLNILYNVHTKALHSCHTQIKKTHHKSIIFIKIFFYFFLLMLTRLNLNIELLKNYLDQPCQYLIQF